MSSPSGSGSQHQTAAPGQARQTAPAVPVPAPPRRQMRGCLFLLLLYLLAALIGSGVAFGVYFLKGALPTSAAPGIPAPSASPTYVVDRHGLPNNVPLPADAVFQLQQTRHLTPKGQAPIPYTQWYWTLPSPNTPTAVQQFYLAQLPQQGWTASQQPSQGRRQEVGACQGTQLLIIAADVSLEVSDDQGIFLQPVIAPPGGAALAIVLVPTLGCTLITPTPVR